MAKIKIIFAIIFLILMLGPIMASPIAKIGNPFNVTISCLGFSCSNINITILAPNSSVVVSNQPMINHNSYASYQLTPNTYGDYLYYISDGTNISSSFFSSTSTGYNLSTQTSIIYVPLFAIIIFVFAAVLFGASRLPSSDKRNEEGNIISISWLKYLRAPLYFVAWMLLIAMLYLSSNLAFAYLGEQLFAQFLFTLFRICLGFSAIIVIVWFFWIFVKIAQDKEMVKLLNKGIFPQGRLP